MKVIIILALLSIPITLAFGSHDKTKYSKDDIVKYVKRTSNCTMYILDLGISVKGEKDISIPLFKAWWNSDDFEKVLHNVVMKRCHVSKS